MSLKRIFVLLGLLAVSAGGSLDAQGHIPIPQRPMNEMTLRPRGQNVVPVYDGWWNNADGTRTYCFSYFNLNTEQQLDIPLGPMNRIEPAQFDGMQPTHFDPVPNPKLTQKYRHHWCIFTVTAPQDMEGDIVWTLESQGASLESPTNVHPLYVLEEIRSSGRMAVAPVVRFSQGGNAIQGRKGAWSEPRQARVGQPLNLQLWIEHQNPGTWLGWTKHQGPGKVTFASDETRLDQASAAPSNTVTFDTPGDYVIRVQAINDPEFPNNPTGGFEFHCCWTNVYLRVRVTG